MKRLGVALALTALCWTTNVFAADMPPPGGPPMPAAAYVPPPPPFSWTGFYIGGNIGYGFASGTLDAFGATSSENLTGVIGGVQAGANYQMGPAVFGIEADFDGSGQSITTTVFGITEADKIPWFGTLRGRLGFAVDRFLVYGTGGVGWGEFNSNISAPGFGAISLSQSHAALAAGAGLEVGITNNVTARIEYLYLDTGNFNLTALPGFSARLQDSIVRAGVNLKFF
jgi:outer membrane immunogenic protein